jgi:hypothetical protein
VRKSFGSVQAVRGVALTVGFGGLFELLFPLLLIVRGFSAGSRARPVPVRTGSARHRDVTAA